MVLEAEAAKSLETLESSVMSGGPLFKARLMAKVNAAPAEEENPSPFPSTPGVFLDSISRPRSENLLPVSLCDTASSLRSASSFSLPATNNRPLPPSVTLTSE